MDCKLQLGFVLVFLFILALVAEERVEAKRRSRGEKRVKFLQILFYLPCLCYCIWVYVRFSSRAKDFHCYTQKFSRILCPSALSIKEPYIDGWEKDVHVAAFNTLEHSF